MTTLTPALVEEYNAFGPWVTTVTSAADVPPVFAGYAIDLGASIRVLKFPRPESRRDLVAGMDLYNYLLVLTAYRITVLERRGSEVVVGDFDLAQLASLSSGANLLDGWLSLSFTTGESYAMPYNGSSSDLIAKLVDTIRGLVVPIVDDNRPRRGVTGLELPLPMDALGRDDAVFSNVANRLGADGATVFSARGRIRVHPREGGFTGLTHVFRPATLHASVMASTLHELIIYSRVEWITRSTTPEISLKRTVVLLDHVDSVSALAHEHYADATTVVITSGQAVLEAIVPAATEQQLVLAASRRPRG